MCTHTHICIHRSVLAVALVGEYLSMENKLWCTHTLAYHPSSFQTHPMLQSSRINLPWTDDACLAWTVLSDHVPAFPLQPSNHPTTQPHPLREVYSLPCRPMWMLELTPAHAVTPAVAQHPRQSRPSPAPHTQGRSSSCWHSSPHLLRRGAQVSAVLAPPQTKHLHFNRLYVLRFQIRSQFFKKSGNAFKPVNDSSQNSQV